MRSILLAALLALLLSSCATVQPKDSAEPVTLTDATIVVEYIQCGQLIGFALHMPGQPPKAMFKNSKGDPRPAFMLEKIYAAQDTGQIPDGPTYRIEVPGECETI